MNTQTVMVMYKGVFMMNEDQEILGDYYAQQIKQQILSLGDYYENC